MHAHIPACMHIAMYNDFQNTLCNVLDKHAPAKKKYLRANDSPIMMKYLRKMIMNKSRFKIYISKIILLETGKDIENFGTNVLSLQKRQKLNISKILI